MNVKRKINYVIMALCALIAILALAQLGWHEGFTWAAVAILVGLIHLVLPEGNGILYVEQEPPELLREMRLPEGTATELALLNEEGDSLATWDIYGKNGIVIGRDTGENSVTVNLDHTTYASMVDVEHAVLNFFNGAWYIEDISTKNGVSIRKSDGKKYKISYGKPCRLELGDVIFIGPTRLQIL